MIYRIVLSIGYKDAYIEFDKAEEATNFAETLLSHYTKPEDEKSIAKVKIEVINPDAVMEDPDNE